MKKNEFLDILNQSLDGEIRPDKIKQNIDYYNQYIGNNRRAWRSASNCQNNH